jgi:hypothetical protein
MRVVVAVVVVVVVVTEKSVVVTSRHPRTTIFFFFAIAIQQRVPKTFSRRRRRRRRRPHNRDADRTVSVFCGFLRPSSDAIFFFGSTSRAVAGGQWSDGGAGNRSSASGKSQPPKT